MVVVYFVGQLAGAAFIPGNAERYATVLKTEDGNFAEDIEAVSYTHLVETGARASTDATVGAETSTSQRTVSPVSPTAPLTTKVPACA